MQNTVTNPVLSNELAYAVKSKLGTTDVKNDTTDLPASKVAIDQRAYPVNVVTEDESTAEVAPIDELKSLEKARIQWENTELAASNARLYSILKKAYGFYLVMKKAESKDTRKAYAAALETLIAERSYIFTSTSHDMNRVVKCVFGVDRRRVSAYSLALREALRQEVEEDELVEFIESNGGVEQIRLGHSKKPTTSAERAQSVKYEVLNNSIGTFKVDAEFSGANADWTDKQVVIVATYLPTGEFEANAVIRNDTAVNAAFLAYYSNQQAEIRNQKKAQKEAEEAEKPKRTSKSSEEKMAAQKALVVAEREADAQKEQAEKSFKNAFDYA